MACVGIDVAVCFCSNIMALVTDCFNVLGPDGTFMHIGQGSAQMAVQAETMTTGVVWVQEAANTALPNGIGGMIIALALFFFAYSTCIAYYYKGESGLAYLCRNTSEKNRGKLIWATRIIMPLFFLIWANVTASTA